MRRRDSTVAEIYGYRIGASDLSEIAEQNSSAMIAQSGTMKIANGEPRRYETREQICS